MTIHRGTVTTLACGCAAYRSRGRARCEEALALNRAFREIEGAEREAEAKYGPASPERRELMSKRIRALEKYTDHLKGR